MKIELPPLDLSLDTPHMLSQREDELIEALKKIAKLREALEIVQLAFEYECIFKNIITTALEETKWR